MVLTSEELLSPETRKMYKYYGSVLCKYQERFDEDGYPQYGTPSFDVEELIALYEKCLREDKSWDKFIDWKPSPDPYSETPDKIY